MKRIYLTLITALVLTLIIGTGSAAATAGFALGADTPVLIAGSPDPVKIPVNITGATRFTGFNIITSLTSTQGALITSYELDPIVTGMVNSKEHLVNGNLQTPLTGEHTLYYLSIIPGASAETVTITIAPEYLYEDGIRINKPASVGLTLQIQAAPAALKPITADPADPDNHVAGTSLRLATEVQDQASAKLEGFTVLWQSSNPLVASVDTSGLCTLKTTGTADITATIQGYPDITAQYTVTVLANTRKDSDTITPGPSRAEGGWSALNNSRAVYTTILTTESFRLPIPEFTRDTITAAILTKTDVDAGSSGASVTYHTNLQPGTEISLTINSDGTITIPAKTEDGVDTWTITFTGRKLGDIDGNGYVDTQDAKKISEYVVGLNSLTSYEQFYADADQKYTVNSRDALAILEMDAKYRYNDYAPGPNFYDRG